MSQYTFTFKKDNIFVEFTTSDKIIVASQFPKWVEAADEYKRKHAGKADEKKNPAPAAPAVDRSKVKEQSAFVSKSEKPTSEPLPGREEAMDFGEPISEEHLKKTAKEESLIEEKTLKEELQSESLFLPEEEEIHEEISEVVISQEDVPIKEEPEVEQCCCKADTEEPEVFEEAEEDAILADEVSVENSDVEQVTEDVEVENTESFVSFEIEKETLMNDPEIIEAEEIKDAEFVSVEEIINVVDPQLESEAYEGVEVDAETVDNKVKNSAGVFDKVSNLLKTINSIQNPEPEVVEEPEVIDFSKILEERIENPTFEPNRAKDERFLKIITGKNTQNKLHHFIITAYYLLEFEKMDRFSLKQINAKLMQNLSQIIDHTVLQEALDNELVEVVPDLTGISEVAEYKLTEKGEDFFVNEI